MIFGLFDQLFPIMFTIIFLFVIGTFIYTAVTGLTTWHKNNQSPRLTVPAKVVAKRQNTTHHSHPVAGDASGAHGFHSTTSTSYYVTFEVESGDRMEFAVRGQDYGMLVEGDEGRLSFQGTRFLVFDVSWVIAVSWKKGIAAITKILKVWMMCCEPQAEPIWLFLNIDPYGFELSDSESWECLERIVKDKEFKVKPVFLTKGKTEREINEHLHIKA